MKFFSFFYLVIFFSVATAFARGGGGCLLEGTSVETRFGGKPIESISVADEIWNPESNSFQKPVDVLNYSTHEILDVEFNQEHLFLTKEHPLLKENGNWIEAAFLKVGDRIILDQKNAAIISKITKASGDFKVFNVILPSGVFSANHVVTHNKGCFLPETEVLMADGSRKAISQIQVGEKVLSFDKDEQITSASVQKVYHLKVHQFFNITLDNKTVLKVTEEHPFYVGNGEFRKVKNLKVSDHLKVLTNSGLIDHQIQSIEFIEQDVDVYNLLTEIPHTYFAAQIAVHNKGGGGGGGGFHGGGGGYHSYGHRSYRSCYDANHVLTTCYDNDWIGLLFTIGFIVGFYILISYVHSKSSSSGSSTVELDLVLSQATIFSRADEIEKHVKQISARDPKFELVAFREIATRAFLTLQECWTKRDYSKMNSLVTGDIAREHKMQIQSMISNREINKIEDVSIRFVRIVHFDYVPSSQYFTMAAVFDVTAKDYYVSDLAQDFLRGDREPHQFQEIWVFKWVQNKWLLSRIEQMFDTMLLNQNVSDETSSKSYTPAFSSGNPAEDPVELIAREVAFYLLFSLESLNVENLGNYLTPRFYVDWLETISKMVNENRRSQFRNICFLKADVTLRNNPTPSGNRHRVRLKFQAQRFELLNSAIQSSDADVRTFSVSLWILEQNGKYLIDSFEFGT